MGTNVKPTDNLGQPESDGKKSDKHADRVNDVQIKAVFFARVQAFSGKGNVTALLTSKSGKSELHGVTNLCKIGLLDGSFFGRTVKAEALADLLGVKVIIGREACVKFLSDNKVVGVKASHILGDVIGRASTDGSGKAGSAFLPDNK